MPGTRYSWPNTTVLDVDLSRTKPKPEVQPMLDRHAVSMTRQYELLEEWERIRDEWLARASLDQIDAWNATFYPEEPGIASVE